MSFCPKPWYLERDCPFCTRSASSFCRDPLYFFAHAMWVKWWYHAKFHPFQSSICTAFQFHGHLALSKQISKWMKNTKWIQKGLIIDDVDLNGAFWTHKNSGVQKNAMPLYHMSFRPNPWYFERDCPFCTRSASSFCRDPLYFLAHAMWVKWWYHAKFQPFQSSICTAFQFHGHLAL